MDKKLAVYMITIVVLTAFGTMVMIDSGYSLSDWQLYLPAVLITGAYTSGVYVAHSEKGENNSNG